MMVTCAGPVFGSAKLRHLIGGQSLIFWSKKPKVRRKSRCQCAVPIVQQTSSPVWPRIGNSTSCCRGSRPANVPSASVACTRSVDLPGRKRALLTVRACGVAQQAGSSASISPFPLSSTQLSQSSLPLVVVVVVVTGVMVMLKTVVVVEAGGAPGGAGVGVWCGFRCRNGLRVGGGVGGRAARGHHGVGDGDGDLRAGAQAAQVAGEAAGARVAHDGRGESGGRGIGHDHVGRGGRPEIARHERVRDGRAGYRGGRPR